MYKKKTKNWLKHYDFIIIDFIAIQLSLVCAFFVRHGTIYMYEQEIYRQAAIYLACIDLLVMFFFESYKGVLKRGYLIEFKATLKHVTYTTALLLLVLFLLQIGEEFSRSTFIYIWMFGVVFSWSGRSIRKRHLKKIRVETRNSLFVIATYHRAAKTIQMVRRKEYENFSVEGICILDREVTGETIEGVPVVACGEGILEYIKVNWVDEVLFNQMHTEYKELKDSIIKGCNLMGITVHQAFLEKSALDTETMSVESIGDYLVVSNSINMITTRQLVMKRAVDIISGIAGVMLTGLLTITIGPIIYIKSPGPIFFGQERIGKNGKKFRMYKFRSMYMDAEKRKAELMALNEVKDGMMFKMENDPRILPGIGHFIRNTSLDEFPQFYNVLKGDMSLIGTRPPTVDEWVKYDLHHRARMAIKPGITGMWQVSGRSNIKDFEEVVALDTKYIQNWTLGLDVKIFLKTIKVVLTKEGSR